MTLTAMLKKIAGVGWKIDRRGKIRTRRAMAGRRCLCPVEAASVLILGYKRPVWIGVRAALKLDGYCIAGAADHEFPEDPNEIKLRALMLKILKPEAKK